MTDSSEEEAELPTRRRSSTPIYLKSHPKTESFKKFVLDEVVIARAMMKSRNIPLSSLSEGQRQRALKLREGIGEKTSLKGHLSIAVKPNRNINETKLEGWGPGASARTVLPPSKVVAGLRLSREGGSKISPRDKATKVSHKKGVEVDFDLEGWSAPPVTSEISPFCIANQPNPFSGIVKAANTESESKKPTWVSESGRKRNDRSITPHMAALGHCSNPVNATDKAHAISSKTIEESVFPKLKQGDHNRLLQSGGVCDSGNFSLTSIEESIAGKLQYSIVVTIMDKWQSLVPLCSDEKSSASNGSGSSIERVYGAVEKVATKSEDGPKVQK